MPDDAFSKGIREAIAGKQAETAPVPAYHTDHHTLDSLRDLLRKVVVPHGVTHDGNFKTDAPLKCADVINDTEKAHQSEQSSCRR